MELNHECEAMKIPSYHSNLGFLGFLTSWMMEDINRKDILQKLPGTALPKIGSRRLRSWAMDENHCSLLWNTLW